MRTNECCELSLPLIVFVSEATTSRTVLFGSVGKNWIHLETFSLLILLLLLFFFSFAVAIVVVVFFFSLPSLCYCIVALLKDGADAP